MRSYAIHSTLGNTCDKASVNGVPQSIFSPLRNGDLVEIVTSEAVRPLPEWADMVVSGKARAEIRRAVNAYERRTREASGRAQLLQAFHAREAGVAPPRRLPSDAAILCAAKALRSSPRLLADVSDVYSAIASGKIALARLVAALRRSSLRSSPTSRRRNPAPGSDAPADATTASAGPAADASVGSETSTGTGTGAPRGSGGEGEGGGPARAVVAPRWEARLGVRLAAESDALFPLMHEVRNAGAVLLHYAVRTREAGGSVHAEVRVELQAPEQLQQLLTSLRSLPRVAGVRELSDAPPQ